MNFVPAHLLGDLQKWLRREEMGLILPREAELESRVLYVPRSLTEELAQLRTVVQKVVGLRMHAEEILAHFARVSEVGASRNICGWCQGAVILGDDVIPLTKAAPQGARAMKKILLAQGVDVTASMSLAAFEKMVRQTRHFLH